MTDDPTQNEIPELDAHLAEAFEALTKPEKTILRGVGWYMRKSPNLTFDLVLHCEEDRSALSNLYSSSVNFHSSEGGFHRVRWIESRSTLNGRIQVTFNSVVSPFLRKIGEEVEERPDLTHAANDPHQ